MKRKKKIIIFITVLVILLLGGLVFYIFTKEDKESTLNLLEKQWIEKNKNELIDFGILNNIAILNKDSNSLIFDFLDSLESTTGLDFNKVSYNYGDEVSQDYSFKVVNEVNDKQIVVYSDNYVLVSKKEIKFNDLAELVKGTIGVKNEILDSVSKYLNNNNLSYKSLSTTYEDLLSTFSKEETGYDYIIVPKLVFFSDNDLYEDLYINYNITEVQDNYVITLGSIDKLNDILTKYYKKWSESDYEKSFRTGLVDTYYKASSILEQDKAKFRSKRYVYGIVENAPFDLMVGGDLYGINSEFIKRFSKLTDVEITWKEYSNVDALQKGLSSNEVDFIFDRYKSNEYDMDVYNTVSMYDEDIVVISPKNKNIVINSVYSLANYDVATLGDTKIQESLSDIAASVKPYSNLKDLLKDNGIIVIDRLTYEYYKESMLSDYKVDYIYNLDANYTYLFRDIKNNEVFEDFFNFYLTFVNEDSIILDGYNNLASVTLVKKDKNILMVIVTILICSIISFLLGGVYAPTKKREKKIKISMKKEDKLRYIDMLTSLKNRNYLNDNIEKWDESEAYPQAVIIVDLNNIAYINDNYGHQEGDNVIKEAASKLISNQLSNSEIIRTNGNEFLIYLVGYEEKDIVNYTKKLEKELKEISHGFGAAAGYSMIVDGIKTIDDAVNEATLAMRQNKEED